MFQNRALGREESLLRHDDGQSVNLAEHADAWYSVGPRYQDEYWKVTTLNLTIAGDGLLKNLDGFGGSGLLDIALELHDGLGVVRDLAPVTFHSYGSAKEWKAGQHNGTLVDLKAGIYDNGSARAGLRGDVRQASMGTVTWTSPLERLRYGRKVFGTSWEADLVRDAAGQPVDSARLVLETGVTGAGSGPNWTSTVVADTGARLDAGQYEFGGPITADAFRWKMELDFFQVGQAAYAEESVRRTSAFFMIGLWIGLDSPWWTIRSLADLIHRGEADREMRAGAWQGGLDLCLIRLPVGFELAGRRRERLRARLSSPGAGLKLLEAHAVADVWYEELD